jgi:threonine/homoserine/homoserine lactone efflux protein
MSARLAGVVLGLALVVILGTFGVSLIRLDSSSDVASVVVAVVGAIGTVIVAFFGIHVADAGRQAAERARSRAEELHLFEQRRVRRLAATTDPSQRAAILNEDPPPEALVRP